MNPSRISRRRLLQGIACGGSCIATCFAETRSLLGQHQQTPADPHSTPSFTGPSRNPYWNSTGPFVDYPQKLPLILLTDRAPQLETPRHYFQSAFTPNEAFYVRWHLDEIPNTVDLAAWKLRIEGSVQRQLNFSMNDLLTRFKPASVVAVNQCSGNSRSKLEPRVPGGQWGNGAMGSAKWTGVPLRELLEAAKIKQDAMTV